MACACKHANRQKIRNTIRHTIYATEHLFYFAFKMRLIVLHFWHGKTQKNRWRFSRTGTTGGDPHKRRSRTAQGAGRFIAGLGANDPQSHSQNHRGRPSHGRSPASPVSAAQNPAAPILTALGRTAAGAVDVGTGAVLFGGLEGQSRARTIGGRDAGAGRLGRKTGTLAQAIGDLSPAGTTPLAQSGSRHPTPQSPAGGAGGMEKKPCPKNWRPC